ncbi:MAG: hypothetical protein R8G60_13140 [Roseovarius pacificus]|nr:hypothetical protein [Roseovarius pacificus]
MSRGSANTARKAGPEGIIEKYHIRLNDPATQLYAIHGDVENSPFRSCIDDLSEVEQSSLDDFDEDDDLREYDYNSADDYIFQYERFAKESETAKKGYDMFMLHDMNEAAKQQIERQPIDIFHSPASFTMTSKGRLKSGIASMTTVCLDIDYHKTDEYCDHGPEEMVSIIHKLCDDFSIPHPGMIVHSGGGLQTYWIFEPLRFSQHPHPSDYRRSVREVNCDRWMSVVTQLWSIFAPLGADHQGNNIVRLLRLVGSKSSRNGNEVRIVHLDKRLMIPWSKARHL